MRSLNWAALIGLALAVRHITLHETPNGFIAPHDTYAQYFPNMIYAAREWSRGVGGLLWNPYQSCGEPFLNNASTGLFYPVNWLFFLLKPDTALFAVIGVNLLIAAFACYSFLRCLDLGVVAAFAGTLLFLFGPMTIGMATWSPIHLGAYVWTPVALLATQRLLSRPCLTRVCILAVVLTLSLLPGYPQIVFFIYLIIALYTLVHLAAPSAGSTRGRTVLYVALAGALPIGLGAVMLLPYAEVWQQSVRAGALSAVEMTLGKNRAATLVQRSFGQAGRFPILLAFAVLALFHPRRRSAGLFFIAMGLLAVGLAYGEHGSLGWLSRLASANRVFRFPERILWMTDFAAAGTVAVGLSSLAERWRRRAATDPQPVPLRRYSPAIGAAALVALSAAVVWQLSQVTTPHPGMRRSSVAQRATLKEELGDLRAAMTPEDRAYLMPPHPSRNYYTFHQRSASLSRIRSLFDYEALMNRRYAEYFSVMRSGDELRNLNDFVFAAMRGWLPPGVRWNMINLVGTRFFVAPSPLEDVPAPLREVELSKGRGLVFYRNPDALPRARFVPAVELVSAPENILHRLADESASATATALIEVPPPSGFFGNPNLRGPASVRFVADEPAQVVLDVTAPQRGFVFLADTLYPGWRATVNGRPTPILRADYAFRLVEVPAGRSKVEFRFRPTSLLIGAATTLATIALLAALLWRSAASR